MISASDYKMQPTDNDVLSGRGAWYNNHPGNKRFRKMLDDQKQAYMTGTKKQKMDISKAIVEAIHSMDPPGRFLKKCPPYGQWVELSKRDAADKAAQAMAWIINGWKKTTLKGEHSQQSRRRRRRRSLPVAKDDRNEDYVDDVQSSQPDDPPTQQNLKRSSSQSESSQPFLSVAAQEDDGVVATHCSAGAGAGADAAVGNNNDDAKSADAAEENEIEDTADEMCRSVPVPRIINIQRHLPSQMLQSNSNNPVSSSSNTIDSNVSQNEILQMLVQILRPQQQQQQQRMHQHHDELFHHSTLDHNNITLGLIQQMTQHSSAASLEALAQLLVQIQHQLNQQQQLIEQQQLLIQLLVLTNHHLNVPSPPLLPTHLSSASPVQLLDNHGTNINMQQPQQHQSEPSNDALMIGAISAVQQSIPNHTQPTRQHQHQQEQEQSLWVATQLGAYVNQMLQHPTPQLIENSQFSMTSSSYTASAGQVDAIDENQDESKQNRTSHR